MKPEQPKITVDTGTGEERCSLCGGDRRQVGKLVLASKVCICRSCVELVRGIFDDEEPAFTPASTTVPLSSVDLLNLDTVKEAAWCRRNLMVDFVDDHQRSCARLMTSEELVQFAIRQHRETTHLQQLVRDGAEAAEFLWDGRTPAALLRVLAWARAARRVLEEKAEEKAT